MSLSLLLASLVLAADAGLGSETLDAGLADAGSQRPYVPFSEPLYATCPAAPPAEDRDGGVWMPDPRPARVACLMATCNDDRRRREAASDVAPPPQWWVVAVSAAVMVGAGMFTLGRATAPPATAPTSPSP